MLNLTQESSLETITLYWHHVLEHNIVQYDILKYICKNIKYTHTQIKGEQWVINPLVLWLFI